MDFLNSQSYRKYLLFLLLLILELICTLVSSQSMIGKVISLRQGDVRGRTSRTRNGRIFTEYWGIPYAKKPQRFELARPGPSWDGIRECSKKPPACYFQTDDCHPQGSEDCLFINVHTPVTHNDYFKKYLPVIVVIHGGFEHYTDQTGHYLGAKYFLDKEIVLVTFNYRLGAFGFFTTQDDTIHANLGLKDQILALKWVQKNIKEFGGNPDSVTLLGYGSGAACAHLHMFSPLSKGLFHKVILQGGNAANPWAIVDDTEKSLTRFAHVMKCDNDFESKAIIECLRKKPAHEFVQETYNTQYMFSEHRNTIGNIYFGPVVEHWMRNYPEKPCFLPNSPQNILLGNETLESNDTIFSIPVLLGNNQFEGVTKSIAEIVDRQKTKSIAHVDWSIPISSFGKFFSYSVKMNDTKKMDVAVDKFYFKGMGQAGIRKDGGLTFFNALSHRNFLQGTRTTAFLHAKYSSKIFLYYMSYFRFTSFLDYWFRGFFTTYKMLKKKRTTLNGPVNGDELQYLFDLDEMGDFPLIRKIYRELSISFSNNMILMWVNFAKTGQPATDWPALAKGVALHAIKWYNIGDKRVEIDEPFRDELNFWDKWFPFLASDLPPLAPKNETTHSRPKPTDNSTDGNSTKEWADIIYIDGTGDDDGTGGLFEEIVPSTPAKKSLSENSKEKTSSGEISNKVKRAAGSQEDGENKDKSSEKTDSGEKKEKSSEKTDSGEKKEKSNENKSNESTEKPDKSGENKSSESKEKPDQSGENKSSESKEKPDKSGENKSSESKEKPDKSGENKSSESKEKPDTGDKDKNCKNKSKQSREKSHTGDKDKSGENKSHESTEKADKDKSGENKSKETTEKPDTDNKEKSGKNKSNETTEKPETGNKNKSGENKSNESTEKPDSGEKDKSGEKSKEDCSDDKGQDEQKDFVFRRPVRICEYANAETADKPSPVAAPETR